MAGRKMPQGKCSFCQEVMTKRKLTNHLEICPKRREIITKAEKGKGETENLFHLKAKFPYSPDFWLDLEVSGSAALKDLDYYLREIWLECCGHLSEFSSGGFFNSEVSMKKKIEDIFSKETALYHSYDFGDTTETIIEKVAVRKGKPTTKFPIVLMSRNELTGYKCLKCDEPAAYICQGCHYENVNEGLLCKEHAENHPHTDDYGEPLEFVNSPRAGVCGYEGPANPPY